MNMNASDTLSHQILRIIDANVNGIGEGLYLVEDQAHLLVNNTTLNQQLKNVGYEFITHKWIFNQYLLQACDSESDTGIDFEALEQDKPRELSTILLTSARRYSSAKNV